MTRQVTVIMASSAERRHGLKKVLWAARRKESDILIALRCKGSTLSPQTNANKDLRHLRSFVGDAAFLSGERGVTRWQGDRHGVGLGEDLDAA